MPEKNALHNCVLYPRTTFISILYKCKKHGESFKNNLMNFSNFFQIFTSDMNNGPRKTPQFGLCIETR